MAITPLCRRACFGVLRFGSRGFASSTERDAAAARVFSRRPDVSNKRLIEQIEATKGPTFFTQWLASPDRVFRKSRHGRNSWIQWFRAKTTDPMYDFRSWKRLQNPFRYPAYFTPKEWAKSDVVRRLIFPDLAAVFASSTALGMYNSFVTSPGNLAVLPPEPFALAALAVGLLVTFRTQSSYCRYKTACQIWFNVISTSRELCSRILTNVPTPKSASNPKILRKRDHGAKLAQTFCHALKYHITSDGGNADHRNHINVDTSDQKILSLKKAAFFDELHMIWDFDDKD